MFFFGLVGKFGMGDFENLHVSFLILLVMLSHSLRCKASTLSTPDQFLLNLLFGKKNLGNTVDRRNPAPVDR